MAEGYLRYYAGDKAKIYSAGVETHGVNPRAVQVMAEDQVDISRQTSDHVAEYADIPFDIVITVCDHAKERCPYFPARVKMVHCDFPDPAKAGGSEEEILTEFRRVRSLIKEFVKKLVDDHTLNDETGN